MTTYLLPFEKMHGLGNDFIVLERRHMPNNVDDRKLAIQLCNRNFAIGADGLIIVDFSTSGKTDFSWNYFNSNGSMAEMCGNGMRCFAKYVYERGLTDEITFSVMTGAGVIKPLLESDGSVTVDMGQAKFFDTSQQLELDGKLITYTYVEIGNPHCVIFRDSEISEREFLDLGPRIEKHSAFQNGVNVEFVKVVNKNEIKCKVWERGAGSTLACGTGACAVLVAANINTYVDNSSLIYLPGGCLKVHWDISDKIVYLNGPASFVYTGQYNLDPKSVCFDKKLMLND